MPGPKPGPQQGHHIGHHPNTYGIDRNMIFIHEPESPGESKESELLRSDFQAWINKCVACTQASAYFCRIPIRTGTGRD